MGAQVSFIADPDAGSWFRGWTSANCPGRRTCQLVADGTLEVTADFTPEPNRIFMSSMLHDGFLLPSQGDAFCQTLATNAGLSGAYKVLLTSGTGSWPSRVINSRGFIRTDGQPVIDDISALDGRTMAGITIDEKGNRIEDNTTYWTIGMGNANARGNEWQTNSAAAVGTTIATTRGSNYIFGGGQVPCNSLARVICTQADRNVPVAPVPDPGRKAFTSNAPWNPSTGLAAADALCMTEATNAQLSGSFKAVLAMPGASALSRFDLSKPPWVRVDGVPFLSTAAEWTTAKSANSSLHMTAMKTSLLYYGIVVGGVDMATAGTVGNTCDGWTSTTGQSGIVPFTWETDIRPFSTSSFCNSANSQVLCFQE